MESIPLEVTKFLSMVEARDPSARTRIERGGEKLGNWWIDFPQKPWVAVEWRPGQGFGLTAGDHIAFGEGPAEIFRTAERAAHRVIQLRRRESNPSGLRAIRELYEITQEEIAEKLNKGQAAISRLETRRDFKIATIGKFIAALGGRIEVRAIFPDGDISLFRAGDAEETAQPLLGQKRRRKAAGYRRSSIGQK
jgi:transcriptional regulator with XRE-family HTH domain